MFIENLKIACAQRGTSPTALLKALGMSSSSVTAWKKGVEPSLGTVYRLANHLGVNPSTLLEGWSDARLDDYNAGYVDCMEDDWADNAKKEPTPEGERDYAKNEHEEEMLLLARHLEPIPAEERKELVKQLKSFADLYLQKVLPQEDE